MLSAKMSGTWSGFSEDYIEELKSGKAPVAVQHGRITKNRQKNKINSKNNYQPSIISKTILPIPEDAKLNVMDDKSHNSEIQNQPVVSQLVENCKTENANPDTKTSNSLILTTNKVEKKVIDLEQFQEKQKRMEEQNRMRKELLSKALADRTKQTEEEVKRLKEIQQEFKKLDALLSHDVAILRNQIEIASLDFMAAQKRYHKLEKEYLDAKVNLHQKLDKKEMLTEHLCAIIEKNEERKADKLNELMERLTIGGKTIEPETQCESVQQAELVKPSEENPINSAINKQ